MPRTAALALLLSTQAFAAPTVLTHQGRLLDSTGTPLTGSQTLDVALFDDPSGGTELWSESLSTSLDAGYFSVLLGEQTPITADVLEDELYVEITVNGDTLPRRRVASVPWALRSNTTTNLTGGSVDATSIQINGTTVIDSSGTLTAPITGVLLSDLNCTDAGHIATWSGSQWSCAAPSELQLPSDLADGDNDTLADLSCSTDQVAQWSGSAWACADLTNTDTLGELTAASAVGIGVSAGPAALSVGGGLALGEHGTCDSNTLGVLQWKEDAGLQVCSGEGWKTISGGSSGSEANPAESCKTLLESGNTLSGVYWIDPDGGGTSPKQQVWCDQDTDGGGWTVLQWDVSAKQQSGGYGTVSDSYGWSLDYQSGSSFWSSVNVKDFYLEVDGGYLKSWDDVTFLNNGRITPKWLFSGGQQVTWSCNSDNQSGSCHFKDGDGRAWGQWLSPSSCCLGGGGIWYHSYSSSGTYNYGLCQNGYPNGDLGVVSSNVTGCTSGQSTAVSPSGSKVFKYAIRY